MTRAHEPDAQELNVLLDKVKKHHPETDAGLIRDAWQFAEWVHEGQNRKSGEPYVIHPISVALILADQMLDGTTITAGLLHDCVEDSEDIRIEDIELRFGGEIAQLVDGVTKLSKLDFTSREEQQAESLRKMFLAMAKDIRVVLIKLADRLHNMRTLKYQPENRRIAIARETLDVYAPLCHRLGIFAAKSEMEDLALRFIDPDGYYNLVELIGMRRHEREATIDAVVSALGGKLSESGIKCEIEGRPKNFFSIYRKMNVQNKPFDEIYDLIAIRVLVGNIPDCYAALGIVHTLWTQIPNRFKDYISMPKANMYQSLHTTVVSGPGPLRGQTFEVQIRTHEMHSTAEYGIAAHWRYKEGRQADALDNKLYWLRQILDWQDDTRDPGEFLSALKVDLLSDEVFVFTPKGDVIDLPRGATPIDFAYRIHSAIGNKCTGAKVNGRMVPLSAELKTGDFVEIITSSSSHGPSRDWLALVKSSEAKSKIRAFLKREFKDENMSRGREILEREAKRLGYQWPQLAKPEFIEPVCQRYSLTSLDDLYVTVGFGGLSSNQVLNRLIELHKKTVKQPDINIDIKTISLTELDISREQASRKHSPYQTNGIIVEGDPDMLVRFAKCCNPLPGDDIVGYITRGRGVSVHRSDCANMPAEDVEPERFIRVQWEGADGNAYQAAIQIIAHDRIGLFADISLMFAKMEIPIVTVSARPTPKSTTTIHLTFMIKNTQQLEKIIAQLLKRSDTIEVFRVSA